MKIVAGGMWALANRCVVFRDGEFVAPAGCPENGRIASIGPDIVASKLSWLALNHRQWQLDDILTFPWRNWPTYLNLERVSMKALFVLLFVSGAALADDAAMLQCRSIADVPGRVACYDAIPLGKAAPAAAAAVLAPTPAQREQSFGMETIKPAKAAVAEDNSISSTIAGKFDGWSGNALIKLSNGQVWRIVDGSSAVLSPMNNPAVTVERNFVGTFFLKIEGTNNSPKVRRVQ